MVYYISLFSKIRCSLTYLPTQKSDVIYECSPRKNPRKMEMKSRQVCEIFSGLSTFYLILGSHDFKNS
jgi:hypothetical protein